MAGQVDRDFVSPIISTVFKATIETFETVEADCTFCDSYAQDNNGGVGYRVFLRGLRKYAGAQMRFGS